MGLVGFIKKLLGKDDEGSATPPAQSVAGQAPAPTPPENPQPATPNPTPPQA
jgi:hypothetical protein